MSKTIQFPTKYGMWVVIGIVIGAGVGGALDNIAFRKGIEIALGIAIGATQMRKGE